MALFFVSHSVSATAIAFVLAWLFGGLSPLISVFSLAVATIRARRFVRAIQNSLEWRAPESIRSWDAIEFALMIFILFAAWKHFAWLMPIMPGAIPSITTLSPTNLGDLPLHVNFIRALANGLEFLPINPIFALEPLRYPFGPDLYNALWESIGIKLSGHLFLIGIVATFSSLVLLRELGGAWAMAAFFLAGGSAVADSVATVDWKSFFLAIWITQRGMLWALPIGLTLLLYLRPHLSGQIRLSKRAVSGLGRLWGVFPLFHAHSFVVVSLLLFALIWRDFGIRRSKEFIFRFCFENRALAWAFIPASLLIHHTSAGFSKVSVVHWRPLWLVPENANWLEAWSWGWKNFGLAGISLMSFSLLVVFVRKFWLKSENERHPSRSSFDELVILIGFFVFFLFVMLAPWEWDNIKVLVWPWILIFSLLGKSLHEIVRLRPSLIWTLVTWVGVGTCFSPGVSVISQSWSAPQKNSTTIWTLEQLAFNEAVLLRVSKKAIFAAAPIPEHGLAYWGRVRALGYPGHLWSHAIEYRSAEKMLDQLMMGTEGWVEAAKALKITHIYWGPDEKLRWGEDEKVWQATLPLIASAGGHEIYEFKETR